MKIYEMDRKLVKYLITGLILPVLFVFSCSVQDSDRFSAEVLQEDHGFLQIPGAGWQTFFRTALEDNTLDGLAFKSGSAYMRWTWAELEPAEGEFAFDMVDDWLKRCRQANQALAFRVMLSWPGYENTIPKWLLDKGVKYTFSECPQEGSHYMVDLEEPTVKMYHERLIRALGERYDGHPDLGLVDIGSVGLWGEWHYYCDPDLMPSDSERKAIIDLYYEAFPNTPLTLPVDDASNVIYANQKGRSAWRGDCWGHGVGPAAGWNHHENSYRPITELMPDGWKTGTVALEPCGTFGSYSTSPKDVVDDAIAWHATFVQNKSRQIPADWLPEIERLVMKLGFRLVLRDMDYAKKAAAGTGINVSLNWENIGIAPPYRDHRIAFRLCNDNGEVHGTEVTGLSILGWLPGEKEVSVNYNIPEGLNQGNYFLEMGVVFHSSPDHVIPIANKGKTADGWYRLGKISVSL